MLDFRFTFAYTGSGAETQSTKGRRDPYNPLSPFSPLERRESCVITRAKKMREQEPLGTDGLAVRDSGEWAKEKLYYLEHYLDIFSVGMRKKWAGKLYYVDL